MRKRKGCGAPPKDSRAELTDFEDSGEWVIHIRHAAVSGRSGVPWLNFKLVRDGKYNGRCNYWLALRMDTEELYRNNQAGDMVRRLDLNGINLLADVELAVAGWLRENPQAVEASAVDLADLMK